MDWEDAFETLRIHLEDLKIDPEDVDILWDALLILRDMARESKAKC